MRILIDGQTLRTSEMQRGIGIYLKEVLQEILKQDFCNEFFITVYSINDLKSLPGFVRRKLRVLTLKNAELIRNHDFPNAQKAYSQQIEDFIKEYGIGLYWTPNPLMNNVFLPSRVTGCLFSATIYDLIPLILKDTYFRIWSAEAQKTYLQKLKLLKMEYDIFFHISENTQKDFIKYTEVKDKININTPLGVNTTYVPYPYKDIPVERPYVLYVGGVDPRKNMGCAIEAFASFVKKKPAHKNFQLYLVCSLDQREREDLERKIKSLGIEDSIILTGYIKEELLVKLFQRAKGLFFPSLYEGFGIPVLEALACGIPVACSNISSLPEVVDSSAILFNPESISEMASALEDLINQPSDLASREKRYHHSKKFSWANTAYLILSNMLKVLKENECNKKNVDYRKTIAWVSPLPPSKSGIAYYSYEIVKELRKFHSIDLFFEGDQPSSEIKTEFQVYPVSYLHQMYKKYDEVIYNIGNNSNFHKQTYKFAWDMPGTVVLHDYNLHSFLYNAFFSSKEEIHYYKDALVESNGQRGESEFRRVLFLSGPDIVNFPASRALIKRCKRTIVHNMWVKDQFSDLKNIEVIPLFAHFPFNATESVLSIRERYSIPTRNYIISCLGFINPNKQPLLVSNVIVKLLESGFPITMVFAGEISGQLSLFSEKIRSTSHSKNFIFTGYQSDKEYFESLLISDIIVNLRKPSMGESSATLMQAFAAGKPCIVSGQRQYMEFPDDVCWKLPDEGEERVLYNYLSYLLQHPEIRERMGENAKDYANKYLSIRSTVSHYIQ